MRIIACVSILMGALDAAAEPPKRNAVGMVLYVDDDAPAGGDGISWTSAKQFLQDALTLAHARGDVLEIRIAQGMYRPDQGKDVELGDVNASFDLLNNIALLGGYAGICSPRPDERDITAYPSILSGDLLGNDGPDFTNYSDNSYRVIRAQSIVGALIEGCTITASQWEPADTLLGGGVFCLDSDLVIQDCRFEKNFAYRGGGIGVRSGNLEIKRCIFDTNKSRNGGAISTLGLQPISVPIVLIEDCTFVSNFCSPIENGGAIDAGTLTTIRKCEFVGNHADDGGAISGRPLTVEDCQFDSNFADYGGSVSGGGTYRRCVFSNNWASSEGGAFSNVTNSSPAHARFIDCLFLFNWSKNLGGGAAYGGAAFINCRFLGNTSGVSSPSQFSPGGAIRAHVRVLIANCAFSGNHSPGAGGAIHIHSNSSASIINSTFNANTSGGPGSAINGPAQIVNCVFGNHTSAPVTAATAVGYSCAPVSLPAGAGNIIADPQFVDPLGPDGIAGTKDDDLRLSETSPCIDAGDTTALPPDEFDLDGDRDTTEPLPLDAFGNARVLDLPSAANVGVPGSSTGSVVDMGCHEYRRPADVAPPRGDGLVNVVDLLAIISAWGACEANAPCPEDANGDGTVGEADLFLVLQHWG